MTTDESDNNLAGVRQVPSAAHALVFCVASVCVSERMAPKIEQVQALVDSTQTLHAPHASRVVERTRATRLTVMQTTREDPSVGHYPSRHLIRAKPPLAGNSISPPLPPLTRES